MKFRHEYKVKFLTYASCAAIAATAAPIAVTAQDTTIGLEEITVTAQKRSESLTDVPISIAAMSGEAMDKTGVRQMREIAEFVPNLTISSGNDNNTAVRIRGVGALTRNIGFDTRVGMYVDGVYLGQSPSQNLDILDLERVEVARGPQGTLFGKNTVAGAINLITRKPDDEFALEVRGEYGNYDSYRVGAILNVPLQDNLFARFSISDNHRDGIIKNITTGNYQNERDGTSMRGQIQYEGEGFDVNIAGDALYSRRSAFGGEAVTDWSGTVYPDPHAPNSREIADNVDNFEKRNIWGLSGTVNAELGGDYALKSITAYRDAFVLRQQDTDHSPLDIMSVNYPDSYEQFSQELQLISPDDKPFKYVAGLYYYDQTGETSRLPTIGSDLSVLLNVLAPPLAPAGPLFEGKGVGTYAIVDTKSWAAFVNGTYDITDRLTLGFGVRYTWEKKEVDFDLIGDTVNIGIDFPAAQLFGVAVGPVIDGKTVASLEDSTTYTDLSPTVSLTYALNDDMNVYAKYSSAFKSGGFNVDFVSQTAFDSGLEFDTETVDAFEFGLKGTTSDRRVRFNLAAFWMDFKDYQFNQFVDLGNNLSTITIRNAAKVRSKGIEAELTWLATEGLMLQGSVGIMDAKFRDFPGGGSARNPNGIGADLSGNELPVAPSVSASLAAQYNHPIDGTDLEAVFRADVTHSGSYYTSADNIKVARPGTNIPYGFNDSYTLLNGRIGLESGENWSIYLWARNLLNKDYAFTDGTDFLGTITTTPGELRTYGLELSYKF
ncbi:TonB-dependent receptor [Kordiimonas sediminis]|uniref:TonB-dependent receptor n=1 Tax=Kordiimonas sediminis TaxID=1735581 RepID=A0A919E8I7_9PROT|nr:TonB-dependent receptor [Kordiimonas sediminis]GHF24916.1 TonB-dependent receptor [Kordiimonas sediminis]